MPDDRKMTLARRRTHADAAVRAMRGWSMRVSGATWAEVAVELGYTDESNAIRAVREYFGELPQVQRNELRELWRARHEVLWKIALTDAVARRPGAVRAATAIARSAAQLDGLDEPTRMELVTPSSEQFDAVIRAMQLASGEGSAEPDLLELNALPRLTIQNVGSGADDG